MKDRMTPEETVDKARNDAFELMRSVSAADLPGYVFTVCNVMLGAMLYNVEPAHHDPVLAALSKAAKETYAVLKKGIEEQAGKAGKVANG